MLFLRSFPGQDNESNPPWASSTDLFESSSVRTMQMCLELLCGCFVTSSSLKEKWLVWFVCFLTGFPNMLRMDWNKISTIAVVWPNLEVTKFWIIQPRQRYSVSAGPFFSFMGLETFVLKLHLVFYDIIMFAVILCLFLVFLFFSHLLSQFVEVNGMKWGKKMLGYCFFPKSAC